MAPFVMTSHRMPQEDTMESLKSMPEEDTDDEDDQESDGEELVVSKTAHLTPRAAEEPLAVDHLAPDAQTLGHEWFTERDIHWSQKFYHEQVAETSHALRQLDPRISLGWIGRIFGITRETMAHHLAQSCWSE
jgi:hypothetical protein